MTYQTKKRNRQARLEVVLSTVFVVVLDACYVLYLVYSEGIAFGPAVKQVSFMMLNFFLIMLFSVPLLFAFLFIGRLTKRLKHKK